MILGKKETNLSITPHNINLVHVSYKILSSHQQQVMLRKNLNELQPDKTNQMTYGEQRLRSAWAFAQSDQSSLGALCVAEDPMFLHADNEDWSDWVDGQDDLSHLWAHRSFCWFCHTVAEISIHAVSSKGLSEWGINICNPSYSNFDLKTYWYKTI